MTVSDSHVSLTRFSEFFDMYEDATDLAFNQSGVPANVSFDDP